MILKKITVKNFRCIKNQSLAFNDYTVLVGRNGSGKSAFLEAVEFFYNPSYSLSDADFYQRSTDQEISVSLEFANISEAAADEFSSYINDGKLVIEKIAKQEEGSAVYSQDYHGSNLSHDGFDHVRANTGRPFNDAYSNLVKAGEYPTLVAQRSEEDGRDELNKWELQNPNRCEMRRDDGKFFGFRNVGAGKMARYFKFLRVPALMDSKGYEENSSRVLKLLVDTFVRGEDGDATRVLEELRDRVKHEYAQILGSPELSLDDVASLLSEALQAYMPNSAAEVEWDPIKGVSIPNPMAVVRLSHGDFVGPPRYHGHGILRAFDLAVVTLLSERAHDGQVEQRERVNEEVALNGSLLIGIDEPELYQHPAQARVVVDRLRSISGSNVFGRHGMVAITTHSPLFVTLDESKSIRVIRRGDGGLVEGGARACSADFEAMAREMNRVMPDGPAVTAESLVPRMSCLFHPTLTEAIFADFVVLVEGDEDVALIESTLRVLNRWERSRRLGVFIVGVNGKNNLDRMCVLLKSLQMPYYAVFDTDISGGMAAATIEMHRQTNNRIAYICDDSLRVGEDVLAGVYQNYAAFEPTLGDVVRNSVGVERWNQLRDEAAAEFGYVQLSQANKNPMVLKGILQAATVNDPSRLPISLVEIVSAIMAAAKIEEEAAG